MASNLLADNPDASAWIDRVKAACSKNPAFGRFEGSVIWSDATGANGKQLVPMEPVALAANINATPYPLLKGHEPGFPVGKVLAAKVFTDRGGRVFVAAVLGHYHGRRLSFRDLGLGETPG